MKLKVVDTEDDNKKGYIVIAKDREFRRNLTKKRLYK